MKVKHLYYKVKWTRVKITLKLLRNIGTRSGPKRPAAEIRGGFFWIHRFIGPIWSSLFED